jgi:hypothetical protein
MFSRKVILSLLCKLNSENSLKMSVKSENAGTGSLLSTKILQDPQQGGCFMTA